MKKDPIIDDIRMIRHKISEKFGHDSDSLINYLIKKEKEYVKKGQYRFLGNFSSMKSVKSV